VGADLFFQNRTGCDIINLMKTRRNLHTHTPIHTAKIIFAVLLCASVWTGGARANATHKQDFVSHEPDSIIAPKKLTSEELLNKYKNDETCKEINNKIFCCNVDQLIINGKDITIKNTGDPINCGNSGENSICQRNRQWSKCELPLMRQFNLDKYKKRCDKVGQEYFCCNFTEEYNTLATFHYFKTGGKSPDVCSKQGEVKTCEKGGWSWCKKTDDEKLENQFFQDRLKGRCTQTWDKDWACCEVGKDKYGSLKLKKEGKEDEAKVKYYYQKDNYEVENLCPDNQVRTCEKMFNIAGGVWSGCYVKFDDCVKKYKKDNITTQKWDISGINLELTANASCDKDKQKLLEDLEKDKGNCVRDDGGNWFCCEVGKKYESLQFVYSFSSADTQNEGKWPQAQANCKTGEHLVCQKDGWWNWRDRGVAGCRVNNAECAGECPSELTKTLIKNAVVNAKFCPNKYGEQFKKKINEETATIPEDVICEKTFDLDKNNAENKSLCNKYWQANLAIKKICDPNAGFNVVEKFKCEWKQEIRNIFLQITEEDALRNEQLCNVCNKDALKLNIKLPDTISDAGQAIQACEQAVEEKRKNDEIREACGKDGDQFIKAVKDQFPDNIVEVCKACKTLEKFKKEEGAADKKLDKIIAACQPEPDKKDDQQTKTDDTTDKVETLADLSAFQLDKASWLKKTDGETNWKRLGFDAAGAVAVGALGGFLTNHFVKANQVDKGFESVQCKVAGSVISGFGDQVSVGKR
jgi:hypothetical protein